ncbi:MAG: oligosaccharide flippase family protein [Planctomycetes bacterium]|nr:oligosaccharide flippase family protein [Planctomycetota bacterium]
MVSLSRNSAITFASNVLTFILGLGTSIIIARVLEPTNKGIYALIVLMPTILLKFGTLGIEASNVYFSGNRKYTISSIGSNSLFYGVTLGLALILIFWIVNTTEMYQNFINSKNLNTSYIWLLMLTLPFSLISGFLNSILIGREKVIQFNCLSILGIGLQVIFLFILLILLDLGVFGAIIVSVVICPINLVLMIVFVNKIEKVKFSFNARLLSDSLRYGTKAYFGNLAQFLNYRLDIFIVAYFLTTTDVGYYALAVGLAEKLWMLPGSIATILFPRVSSIKIQDANNLTPKVSRNTLFIMLLLALGLLFVCKPVIRIMYGFAYLPSVKPFMLLLPGIVALGVGKIFTADLAGRGRPEFGTLAAFVSLAINICLNIWFIPKWGIAGAAFASTIAYSLATLIALIAYLEISGNSLLDTLIIKKQDIQTYFLPILHRLKMLLVDFNK